MNSYHVAQSVDKKKTHIYLISPERFTVLAVDKAYKLLLEPEQRKRALDVIHAGQEYVEHIVSVQHIPLLFRHSRSDSMLLALMI